MKEVSKLEGFRIVRNGDEEIRWVHAMRAGQVGICFHGDVYRLNGVQMRDTGASVVDDPGFATHWCERHYPALLLIMSAAKPPSTNKGEPPCQ